MIGEIRKHQTGVLIGGNGCGVPKQYEGRMRGFLEGKQGCEVGVGGYHNALFQARPFQHVPVLSGLDHRRGATTKMPLCPDPLHQGRETALAWEYGAPGSYDVSPDGRHVLIAEPVGDPPEPAIRVVQNSGAEFKDR